MKLELTTLSECSKGDYLLIPGYAEGIVRDNEDRPYSLFSFVYSNACYDPRLFDTDTACLSAYGLSKFGTYEDIELFPLTDVTCNQLRFICGYKGDQDVYIYKCWGETDFDEATLYSVASGISVIKIDREESECDYSEVALMQQAFYLLHTEYKHFVEAAQGIIEQVEENIKSYYI